MQTAVTRCFREAFLLRLQSFAAADWLCGITHLGLLTDDLLERWLVAPEDGALDELTRFIKNDLGVGAITGAFWEDVSSEGQRRILQWSRSDAVRGRLWAALERATGKGRANIEAALAVIGHPGRG
jgi:hypothetical protein